MLGCTTILWTDASQSDLAALHAALSVVDGTIEHVARAAMAARVAIRRQSGPLVVLAATDVDASIALRSGADEVIRAGELTEQLVQVTVERAALRYSARATVPVGDDAHEHGMDLLTRAFAMTLRAPLSRAESDFHALWDGLGRTMYATERLAEWGALNAPIDQLRDLAALRASAPSSNELQARVESLRTSLSRSGSVLRSFSELLVDDSGTTRVDDVAYRLIELLRERAPAVGDFACSLTEATTSVPRVVVVPIVGGLLAHGIAWRASVIRPVGAVVEVRVFEEEGAAVIDLRTDAAMPEMSADGGPMMSQLLGRVRRVGGDLFVDGDTSAFTVRVVLPGGAMTEGASVQQVARMRLVS